MIKTKNANKRWPQLALVPLFSMAVVVGCSSNDDNNPSGMPIIPEPLMVVGDGNGNGISDGFESASADDDANGNSIVDVYEVPADAATAAADTNTNGIDDSFEASLTGGTDANSDGVDDAAAAAVADGGPQPTYFNGTINGEDITGDGITISQPTDSSLEIRGLWGRSQSYFQVDIVLNQTADGTYRLDGNAASGEISEIVGQDAVGATYRASGAESDTVTIVWDQEAGRIDGSFAFTAIGVFGTNSDLVVSGEFKNNVSESQMWDCNFDAEFISRCWFIE